MSPDDSLITSGSRVYALAEPGKQYVIYAATGGDFSINLASGVYTAHRYNPRDGSDMRLEEVSGRGSHSLSTPDQDDWVIYLKTKR